MGCGTVVLAAAGGGGGGWQRRRSLLLREKTTGGSGSLASSSTASLLLLLLLNARCKLQSRPRRALLAMVAISVDQLPVSIMYASTKASIDALLGMAHASAARSALCAACRPPPAIQAKGDLQLEMACPEDITAASVQHERQFAEGALDEVGV